MNQNVYSRHPPPRFCPACPPEFSGFPARPGGAIRRTGGSPVYPSHPHPFPSLYARHGRQCFRAWAGFLPFGSDGGASGGTLGAKRRESGGRRMAGTGRGQQRKPPHVTAWEPLHPRPAVYRHALRHGQALTLPAGSPLTAPPVSWLPVQPEGGNHARPFVLFL